MASGQAPGARPQKKKSIILKVSKIFFTVEFKGLLTSSLKWLIFEYIVSA